MVSIEAAMSAATIIKKILAARGIVGAERDNFLSPRYDLRHDPFLLPDMEKAVERLIIALEHQEHVTIYGDYDIDGLTATTVLLDAFESFGFKHVKAFIPNRFVEGYGLTVEAVERIIKDGTHLIVTVDCGSLSHAEVERVNQLGAEIIITDHHNVSEIPPPAVATINPKRIDHNYPFIDLAGVGVAFKLVQALQTRLDGLVNGQEKWLLDLVALGTVCDIVTLKDENRTNVYWGLKVLSKTRRPGLRALMAVAGVDPQKVSAKSLGFGLGPRMNATGRLETAQYSLDMLRAEDPMEALEVAQQLDSMNNERRRMQDNIYKEAIIQAEKMSGDNVLVVSSAGWSHGIIGIVAAKLLEKYKKPTYVLEEMGDESKGSARSYGEFSAVDAIRASDDLIIKGGGHKLAAGVTMKTNQIAAFRRRVNEFYRQQNLHDQAALLLPTADVIITDIAQLNEELVKELSRLEPCGAGNLEPIFCIENGLVEAMRTMGADNQHIKLTITITKANSSSMQFLAFNAPEHFFTEPGGRVKICFTLGINEWQGRRSVEGRLLHLEAAN